MLNLQHPTHQPSSGVSSSALYHHGFKFNPATLGTHHHQAFGDVAPSALVMHAGSAELGREAMLLSAAAAASGVDYSSMGALHSLTSGHHHTSGL